MKRTVKPQIAPMAATTAAATEAQCGTLHGPICTGHPVITRAMCASETTEKTTAAKKMKDVVQLSVGAIIKSA